MSAEAFEPHRPHLFGLAYRMLGSVAEAEDTVQDTYLRWQSANPTDVQELGAWLSRVATRLCLDRLKSARARREVYTGSWLPEPVVESSAELAHDLSVALLLTLERLSPLERAAFLLHDVFDVQFPEIATRLDRTEAACRQLASRARRRVRESGAPQRATAEQEQRLSHAFLSAVHTGDLNGLMSLLTSDVVCVSDGGGKVGAALRPVVTADHVARFLVGASRKFPLPEGVILTITRLNTLPGFILWNADHTPLQTVALELDGEQIRAIYVVRNPDKLAHLHYSAFTQSAGRVETDRAS